MKTSILLGFLTAIIKQILDPAVVAQIKQSILDFVAAAQDGWTDGELRATVEREAREVAAATPNPYDDMLVEVAVFLYARKYIARGVIPAPKKA